MAGPSRSYDDSCSCSGQCCQQEAQRRLGHAQNWHWVQGWASPVCAARQAERPSGEQCTSRCGSRRLEVAIVARYRPSRRQRAVEKSVTGLLCRVQACIRLVRTIFRHRLSGFIAPSSITTTNTRGPRLAHSIWLLICPTAAAVSKAPDDSTAPCFDSS